MTTELNPSPASEPQGPVQAQSSNGAPQTQNQPGQHPQGQGQGQGHRRRRRRRNKGGQAKGQPNGAPPQNGAPTAGPVNATSTNGSSSPAPASHQGHPKQKSGKRFFQKSPGNPGNYGEGREPLHDPYANGSRVPPRLTRRADQGHSSIITKIRKGGDGASADADECAPACRETCARQDEQRVVAERAAILAHRDTQRADLMMACRIEQARQDREHGSNEKHRWPPCALTGVRFANPASSDFA